MKVKYWTEKREGVGGPLAGCFGHLELDDRPVPEVTDFSVHTSVGDVARAQVRLIATQNVDIEVEAHAEVTIVAIPGWRVVSETFANGRVHYWTEREAAYWEAPYADRPE